MNVKQLAEKYGYSGISSILRQFARESYEQKKIGSDTLQEIEDMAKDLENVLVLYTEYSYVLKK